jgi:hypothetical protein
MAEEGPAPAMASATDHEYSSHGQQQPIHITPNPPAVNSSRKSTLVRMEELEILGDGTQTPMSYMGGHRTSRHMVDLDEYFVCPYSPPALFTWEGMEK